MAGKEKRNPQSQKVAADVSSPRYWGGGGEGPSEQAAVLGCHGSIRRGLF